MASDLIVVTSDHELESMEDYLLSRERCGLALAIAPTARLPNAELRNLMTWQVRIYELASDRLVSQQSLPPHLALQAGTARIWWPGLTVGSDAADHPTIGMPPSAQDWRDHLSRHIDLSRPSARHETYQLEMRLQLAERQLAVAREYAGELSLIVGGHLAPGVTPRPLLAATFGASDSETSSRTEHSDCEYSRLLTPREQEVLKCLNRGETYSAIGAQLNISAETVKTHTVNIRRKLGIASKRALIGITPA
jgi:DNA-binding CsgD family transcriptional regulator